MKTSSLLLLTLFLAACAAPGPKPYSGTGGMAAYDIKPEVYAHHYQRGFTGPDAMGWDPNLQYVWSRLGAAVTCNVPFDRDKTVAQLVEKFGHSTSVHGLVGIDFHHAQSKAAPGFCTPAVWAEVASLVPEFEGGRFTKKF